MTSWCVCLWVLLFVGGPADAAERLAVLDLQSKTMDRDQRALLGDEVRGAVVRAVGKQIEVMTQENMEVMLSDMGIDASCVSEGACEVETARNLGVDYVVSGTVVPMGDQQIMSLKLHQTDRGVLLASERTQGADSLALLNAIEPLTIKLMAAIDSAPAAAPKPASPAPRPKPEPAAPTASLDEVNAALADFKTLKMDGAPAGSSKKAEDAALTSSLKVISMALKKLEGDATALVQSSGDDVNGRGQALFVLGQAYQHMAHALRTSKKPFYLDASDVEIYVMALEDKAYVQDEKAINAYRLVLENEAAHRDGTLALAEIYAVRDSLYEQLNILKAYIAAAGSDAEIEALIKPLAERADYEASPAGRKEAKLRRKQQAAEKVAADKRDRDVLGSLNGQIQGLASKVAANKKCIDADSQEEIGMVLEQAQMVIEADETSMAGDIQTMLTAYESAVDDAIAGCGG